jgi:hypothetical protein
MTQRVLAEQPLQIGHNHRLFPKPNELKP